MIETRQKTVILRNQSKTCIYVRVEVELEASWRCFGGLQGAVWRRLGASGRGRGACRGRLVKQTRPSGSNSARDSTATGRKRAETSANERAPGRTRGSRSIYLARHMIRSSLSIYLSIYLSIDLLFRRLIISLCVGLVFELLWSWKRCGHILEVSWCVV